MSVQRWVLLTAYILNLAGLMAALLTRGSLTSIILFSVAALIVVPGLLAKDGGKS